MPLEGFRRVVLVVGRGVWLVWRFHLLLWRGLEGRPDGGGRVVGIWEGLRGLVVSSWVLGCLRDLLESV